MTFPLVASLRSKAAIKMQRLTAVRLYFNGVIYIPVVIRAILHTCISTGTVLTGAREKGKMFNIQFSNCCSFASILLH